ncbi:MAG: hypothetical protein PHR68_04045 [Candidatus Gracilibacteria bacterium]|nr:hypothetical protein [Candidatus Gracilibacteria bacterium]
MENKDTLYIGNQQADTINNIEKQNIFNTIYNNFNIIKEKPISFIVAILLPLIFLIYGLLMKDNIILFILSFILFIIYYIVNTNSFITNNKILKFFKILFIYIICLLLSYGIINFNIKDISSNSSLKRNSQENSNIIKNTETIVNNQDKKIIELQSQIEQMKLELSQIKGTSEKSVSVLDEAITILKTKK